MRPLRQLSVVLILLAFGLGIAQAADKVRSSSPSRRSVLVSEQTALQSQIDPTMVRVFTALMENGTPPHLLEGMRNRVSNGHLALVAAVEARVRPGDGGPPAPPAPELLEIYQQSLEEVRTAYPQTHFANLSRYLRAPSSGKNPFDRFFAISSGEKEKRHPLSGESSSSSDQRGRGVASTSPEPVDVGTSSERNSERNDSRVVPPAIREFHRSTLNELGLCQLFGTDAVLDYIFHPDTPQMPPPLPHFQHEGGELVDRILKSVEFSVLDDLRVQYFQHHNPVIIQTEFMNLARHVLAGGRPACQEDPSSNPDEHERLIKERDRLLAEIDILSRIVAALQNQRQSSDTPNTEDAARPALEEQSIKFALSERIVLLGQNDMALLRLLMSQL